MNEIRFFIFHFQTKTLIKIKIRDKKKFTQKFHGEGQFSGGNFPGGQFTGGPLFQGAFFLEPLKIFPKYLSFEKISKKCTRVPGPLISLCYFNIWIVASYIKTLTSSANFSNAFKGTYESPRMAAFISRQLLMFR